MPTLEVLAKAVLGAEIVRRLQRLWSILTSVEDAASHVSLLVAYDSDKPEAVHSDHVRLGDPIA